MVDNDRTHIAGDGPVPVFRTADQGLLTAALSGRARYWPWLLALLASAALGLHLWAAENLPGGEAGTYDLLELTLNLGGACSCYLLPPGMCLLTWTHLQAAARQDAFAQLLLTPAPRRAILRAMLYAPRRRVTLLYVALLPMLLCNYITAWAPAFPLTQLLGTWNTGVVDGQCWNWWFTRFDPHDGRLLAAMAAVVGLHCAMRHATTAAALGWASCRGSRRGLPVSMVLALAPLAAGLALVHAIQAGIMQPAMRESADTNALASLVSDYLRARTPVSFYHALAATNATILMPVGLASLASGLLLRRAARHLDRMLTD